MDIAKGYQIQQDATFENGRGFALSYNPSAQTPFVIWHYTVIADGKRNFYDYTSCKGVLPPEKEFARFLSTYNCVYKVQRQIEGQKTSGAKYFRYYTKYPLDNNTFPKGQEFGLLEIAPYEKRLLVENGTIQTWGELIYTKPLTEKQMADYELTPAANNPDREKQREGQLPERKPDSIVAQLREGAQQTKTNREPSAKKSDPIHGDR